MPASHWKRRKPLNSFPLMSNRKLVVTTTKENTTEYGEIWCPGGTDDHDSHWIDIDALEDMEDGRLRCKKHKIFLLIRR